MPLPQPMHIRVSGCLVVTIRVGCAAYHRFERQASWTVMDTETTAIASSKVIAATMAVEILSI